MLVAAAALQLGLRKQCSAKAAACQLAALLPGMSSAVTSLLHSSHVYSQRHMAASNMHSRLCCVFYQMYSQVDDGRHHNDYARCWL
jgi:TctA family transporter